MNLKQVNYQVDLPKKYYDLIVVLAKKVAFSSKSNIIAEDLIGSGFIGYVDAVNRYDPSKSSLAHYARYRIQGEMFDFLRRDNTYFRTKNRNIQVLSTTLEDSSDTNGSGYYDVEDKKSLDFVKELENESFKKYFMSIIENIPFEIFKHWIYYRYVLGFTYDEICSIYDNKINFPNVARIFSIIINPLLRHYLEYKVLPERDFKIIYLKAKNYKFRDYDLNNLY